MRHTALLFLALLALAGCGGAAGQAASASKTAEHTLTVHFELNAGPSSGVYCDTGGRGGYSDIGPTTAITVYDGSQHVIATAPLGSKCTQGTGGAGQTPQWVADWTTTISDVPDVPIYQVEVGNRGKLTYARAALAAKDWTVTTSLGDGS